MSSLTLEIEDKNMKRVCQEKLVSSNCFWCLKDYLRILVCQPGVYLEIRWQEVIKRDLGI